MPMNAIETARNLVDQNIREKPAKSNRHPVIDKMLTYCGVALGNPWCAAFVTYAFHLATGTRPAFASASSQAQKRWGIREKRLFTEPQRLLEIRGAIGGWTNEGDPAHGHAFIVDRRFTDTKGRLLAIGTIEGNTNGAGSRLGDGAYRLRRAINPKDGLWYVQDEKGKFVGTGQKLYFIDTTGIPGGEWWPKPL